YRLPLGPMRLHGPGRLRLRRPTPAPRPYSDRSSIVANPSVVNRLLLLRDVSRYRLLRFRIASNGEIRYVEIVSEELPLCFTLHSFRLHYKNRSLIFDTNNSRSRFKACNPGSSPNGEMDQCKINSSRGNA